jgi:hypothetical protein
MGYQLGFILHCICYLIVVLAGQELFKFFRVSRLALGPSCIQGVNRFLMGVKQLGCDVDCSPPFRARVKRSGSVFVQPLYAFMA